MALSKLNRRLLCLENTYLKYTFVKKNRCEWESEVCKGRRLFGEYHHLFPVLRRNEKIFMEYTRMSIPTFDYILDKISCDVEKQETNWRRPIGAEERLVVTLRYLATGAQFKALAFSFRMGASTVRKIVCEICRAIWKNLLKEHMPKPTTEMLIASREGFWDVWNFPNCVGAIDGKHCHIKSPRNSGSKFFNYKKFFSIVLQAVADYDYKFLAIDVGARGSQNDGGTFAASSLAKCLKENTFNMPPDCILPNSTSIQPNVIIADDAYPLKSYLLKPYARRNLTSTKTNFNYRLSRARRCIECAFGILYAKWRILAKNIEMNEHNATLIIQCVCLLHNVVRDRDGENDPVLREVRYNAIARGPLNRHRRNNRYTTAAQRVRDAFAEYLKSQRLLKGNYTL